MFRLNLRENTGSSETDSSDSKVILSEKEVAIATSKEEKLLLGDRAGFGSLWALRMLSQVCFI